MYPAFAPMRISDLSPLSLHPGSREWSLELELPILILIPIPRYRYQYHVAT